MQLFDPIWILITSFLAFRRSISFHSAASLIEEPELLRSHMVGNTFVGDQKNLNLPIIGPCFSENANLIMHFSRLILHSQRQLTHVPGFC